MSKPFDFSLLQRGDVLIYGGNGLVDYIIGLKTWSRASHVEIFAGLNESIASRNGIGVGLYPLRVNGLRYVLRPNIAVDFDNGMAWFKSCAEGRPYGWSDLLAFTPFLYWLLVEKLKIIQDKGGLICSEFCDLFFLNCGAPLFNQKYPAGVICPRDNLITPRLDLIWSFDGSDD